MRIAALNSITDKRVSKPADARIGLPEDRPKSNWPDSLGDTTMKRFAQIALASGLLVVAAVATHQLAVSLSQGDGDTAATAAATCAYCH